MVDLDVVARGDPQEADRAGSRVERRPVDVALDDLHPGQCLDPRPDVPFQQRTAGQVSGEPVGAAVSGAQHVSGRREVDFLGLVVQHRHVGGGHVVEQAGEQFFELVSAAGHQQMNVLSLRYGRAVYRLVGQVVAFVEGDGRRCRRAPGLRRARRYSHRSRSRDRCAEVRYS